MTCQTTLPWCKGESLTVAIMLRRALADWCQNRPEGPTWCQGGEPWAPVRVADLTWGRMHL